MPENKTAAGDVDPLGDLYKFFMFIGIAVGLTLYLQMLKNRRYWVILEMCFGAVSVVMYFFATTILPMYQKVDSLNIYFFRMMIFAKTGQTAIIYWTRNSRDPTVGISVSITNILARGVIVLCAFHGLYFAKDIPVTPLKMDVINLSLLIIGDLCHLCKLSTRDGNLTVGDPISLHLSIDAFVTFLYGATLLGFPEMFLGTVNSRISATQGHIALAKIVGIHFLGGAVLSLASLCFKNAEDAVFTLKSKLVCYAPAILYGGYLYLTNVQYQGPGHTVLMPGMLNLLLLNAGYAVWQYKSKYD